MTLNFVETAWLNAAHYNNAMDVYQTHLASKASKATGDAPKAAAAAPVQAKSSNLVNKIQETRNNIKEALNKPASASDSNLEARIESVEAENKALKSELAGKIKIISVNATKKLEADIFDHGIFSFDPAILCP